MAGFFSSFYKFFGSEWRRYITFFVKCFYSRKLPVIEGTIIIISVEL